MIAPPLSALPLVKVTLVKVTANPPSISKILPKFLASIV